MGTVGRQMGQDDRRRKSRGMRPRETFVCKNEAKFFLVV